jgi:hypothetical protein
VNQRLDAARLEVRLHGFASAAAHREQMVDVPAIELWRHVDRRYSSQGLPVSLRQSSAPIRPARQQGQTRSQDRRLHLVQARVHTELDVVIAIGLPAVSDTPCADGHGAVGERQRAAVAERAQVLRRVEAVAGGRAEAADGPITAGCQVRLAAVLDDGQAVARRHVREGGHVRRLPVQMHRHDRRRA